MIFVHQSYVRGQVPSNMIIGKVRPSVYLCAMAMAWSGVSGVKNYQGFIAVRFSWGGRGRCPLV